MRHYLLPEEGNFYKANLHTHSTVSDGKYTPAELKEIYKSSGYQILAISDHELLVEHSELDDEDFITLTAVEYAIIEPTDWLRARTIEFNMFARDQHNTTQVCFSPTAVKHGEVWRVPDVKYVGEARKKEYSLEFIQKVIDEANANGFIVSLNHPTASFLTPELVRKFRGLFAMEIYNQDCFFGGVKELNLPMYEEMLRYGKPWACIAADDFHSSISEENPARGFVMIKAKELKYGAIIDALERGDFYASTGPTIEELYIEDGIAHIKCSPVKTINMETPYRPRGGSRRAKGDEYITEATFRVPAGVSYIKFDLFDERGNFASTRAYLPDGSREMPCTPFFDESKIL